MQNDSWSKIVTNAGVNLFAAGIGHGLEYTKATGGSTPADTDPTAMAAMTEIADPIKDFPITAAVASGNITNATVQVSNTGITGQTDLYVVGIFGQLYDYDTDGNKIPISDETLIEVYATNFPIPIPLDSGNPMPNFTFDLNVGLVHGNTSEVTVNIDVTAYITVGNLDDALEPIEAQLTELQASADNAGRPMYGIISTAADEPNKSADVDGFALLTGKPVILLIAETNTVTDDIVTLNVSDTGAAAMTLEARAALIAGKSVQFVYNGTEWDIVGGVGGGSDYETMSVEEGIAGTSEDDRVVNAANLNGIVTSVATTVANTVSGGISVVNLAESLHHVVWQLAEQQLIDDEDIGNVSRDEIDSPTDVNLISGLYSSADGGKVLI
ncbi:MAG: hypothetical protein LBN43_05850 [Oscillospiraceae bacterium]|jgi:hypothetical protein|nr:hypothetical protein [Oscillospiraceae bacterium]